MKMTFRFAEIPIAKKLVILMILTTVAKGSNPVGTERLSLFVV